MRDVEGAHERTLPCGLPSRNPKRVISNEKAMKGRDESIGCDKVTTLEMIEGFGTWRRSP